MYRWQILHGRPRSPRLHLLQAILLRVVFAEECKLGHDNVVKWDTALEEVAVGGSVTGRHIRVEARIALSQPCRPRNVNTRWGVLC